MTMPYPRRKPGRRPGARPRGAGRDGGGSRSPRPRSGRPARSRYARRPAGDDEDDRYGRGGYGRYGRSRSSGSKMPLFLGIGGVAVVVIIIAVVATRGGGGASSPEDAVRNFRSALQAKDGSAIYDAVSRNSIDRLIRQLNSSGDAPDMAGMSDREKMIFAFNQVESNATLSTLCDMAADFEIRDVQQQGSVATVTVFHRALEVENPVRVIREGGCWKVDQGLK